MKMQPLTTAAASSLVGKTIKWQAPTGTGNEGYGGKMEVNEVAFNGTINGIVLHGDNLSFAYPDYNGDYCYADDDRGVTFEILN